MMMIMLAAPTVSHGWTGNHRWVPKCGKMKLATKHICICYVDMIS